MRLNFPKSGFSSDRLGFTAAMIDTSASTQQKLDFFIASSFYRFIELFQMIKTRYD